MPRTPSRSLRAAALVVAASAALVAVPLRTTAAAPPTSDRLVSADPADFTPDVDDGEVDAVAKVGGRIIAVGDFSSVTEAPSAGGETFARHGIFAFDAATGRVDPDFVPDVGSAPVADVVAGGDGTMFIAGAFDDVNGAPDTAALARIDATTGRVVGRFDAPSIKGKVNDLHLANGRLYIGGQFTQVADRPRTALAALDPQTGADTGAVALRFAGPWNGGAVAVKHFDVSDDGSTLVAVGNFRRVEASRARRS